MRPVIAYLLLFALMLPTLSPWGTVAYFRANRAYIAKVLCENRAKPQLKCNGKCYLAKMLKKQQEKKDKETTEQIENLPVGQLFFLGATRFVFNLRGFVLKQPSFFFYRLSAYNSPLSAIRRPPWL